MKHSLYLVLSALLLACSSPVDGAIYVGWVAGGSPYTALTTDGSTWTSQATALNVVTTNDMNGVHAINSSTAMIVGNNTASTTGFFRTIDGGATWTESSLTGVSGNPSWFEVHFAGSLNGRAVGANLWVAASADGGANWAGQQLSTFGHGTPNLNAVQVVNANLIFAVGNNGHIIRSNDGGGSWGLTRFDGNDLNDVMFIDASRGWTVGQNSVIYHTFDAGLNWALQTSPINNTLNGVWFTSNTVGWAVGNGGRVLGTIDGGATWTYLYGSGSLNGTSVFDTHILNGITFGDSQTGWIIGNNGQIWGTNDGGSSWVTQFGPSGVPALHSISMVTTVVIPEPSTLTLLLVCGLGGIAAMILRGRTKRQNTGV